LRWISSVKYNAHHREIIENVLEGSGKWLFEKAEFRQWSSMATSSLLWIRGDRELPLRNIVRERFTDTWSTIFLAGSGKTYLM
jgi:hypothetical protein